MMKGIALSVLYILMLLPSFAQDFDRDSIFYTPIEKGLTKKTIEPPEPKRKSHYYFNFLSGTLIGNSGINGEESATYSFTTTHGVRLGNRLSVGVGLGFDSYWGWKAMPVFGSLSYDLLGKKNRLFVQLNYGKSWVKKAESQYEYGTTTYNGGGMINPSLGYKIVYHDLRLYILAGFKMQKVNMYTEYPGYYSYANRLIAPTPNSSYSNTELSMNRAYFSIGFGWK